MRVAKGFTLIKLMIVIAIIVPRFAYSQDSLELDLDVMWDQVIWEEIEDVTTEVYEVDNITAVAGVRGAEAEDEALAYLYYRKSMKGISQADYRKAYGKLKNKRDELFKKNSEHPRLERMDKLLLELKNKIRNV